MANRYVIKFSKEGYVKYISHLDLLRLFKRSFKKTRMALVHSQGFNPHPKMGFAQPLSLGYSSRCELIEFETVSSYETSEIMRSMLKEMPEGIKLISCETLPEGIKSLAGEAESALYRILIPLPENIAERLLSEREGLSKLKDDYLAQKEITALKRQKKTKDYRPVDIRPMIRSIEPDIAGESLVLDALLDCGSQSNLSPELVISSFLEFNKWEIPREEIEVERREIYFYNNLHF